MQVARLYCVIPPSGVGSLPWKSALFCLFFLIIAHILTTDLCISHSIYQTCIFLCMCVYVYKTDRERDMTIWTIYKHTYIHTYIKWNLVTQTDMEDGVSIFRCVSVRIHWGWVAVMKSMHYKLTLLLSIFLVSVPMFATYGLFKCSLNSGRNILP